MPGRAPRAWPAPRRGAALLLAMVILTLVATLAAGMVWQQTRAVSIEAAERARTQSSWILAGALDWARLILREDQRANDQAVRNGQQPHDGLDEPWATPLAEARLSTFLAADRDNNAEGGPEAFLSGTIVDAQSRWNLRSVLDQAGKISATDLASLRQLVEWAGAPADTADRIAQGLAAAWGAPSAEGNAGGGPVPLAPARLSDLAWLGVDPATIERLSPYLAVLPVRTPVNVNTAPREVIAAAVPGLDLGTAERLVQSRQRTPFDSLEAVKAQLPGTVQLDPARIGVTSRWFEVSGRLRLEERVLEERSLVERRQNDVVVRQRERLSMALAR